MEDGGKPPFSFLEAAMLGQCGGHLIRGVIIANIYIALTFNQELF